MRWRNLQGQGRVEDRRQRRAGRAAAGGFGAVGVVVVLLIVLFGGGEAAELGDLLTGLDAAPTGQRAESVELTPEEQAYAGFVEAILGDLDVMWTGIFDSSGLVYHPPTLVLFRGTTGSGCGTASEQVGPHYCPVDATIYIDETFFDEVLVNRLGTQGGDFAEAYVIAHEVGHHVQNELGITEEIRSQQLADPAEANDLSVRLELQADCLAGIWAFSLAQRGDILEPTDIVEALDAAAAVGDDRIQTRTSGMINPETWTHGSSEARVGWFTTGYESGDPDRCDTFGDAGP